jgi:DNA-binding NarL/FixJ family response regulator
MVLVIDDDKVRAEPLCSLLDLLNVEFVHLTRASEVPSFMRDNAERVRVIVLDILMPNSALVETLRNEFQFSPSHPSDETGLVLFDYLRDRFPQIRVIVHSVVREARITDRIVGENVMYIQKPSTLVELVQAIGGGE